jgi:predicted transcriptional regulator YheO
MKTKNRNTTENYKKVRLHGSVDNFLENLRPVVDAIAGIFGKNCEVVLHDLSHPERSIVAIANEHVTGKKGGPVAGCPLDDLGLEILLKKKNSKQVLLENYLSRTRDGRQLKSTTVVFRNSRGLPVSALCINLMEIVIAVSVSFHNGIINF